MQAGHTPEQQGCDGPPTGTPDTCRSPAKNASLSGKEGLACNYAFILTQSLSRLGKITQSNDVKQTFVQQRKPPLSCPVCPPLAAGGC